MKASALSAIAAVSLMGTAVGAAEPENGGADRAPPVTRTSSGTVENVYVSATRRGETDIRTTPIAVSSVDSAAIATMVPQNIGELSTLVPNFSAAQITGFNAASFSIRGIGLTDIIVYLDAPVAVMVDDFVMPSVQTQLLDTFDIDRVEVLRGPQGTLFGKNTTGGVVQVFTKRPALDRFGAEGSFRYGNFDTVGARLALNVPIVEGKLALRANLLYDNNHGYYRNGAAFGPVTPFDADNPYDGATGQGDGSHIGGKDVWGGRIKLLWQPTDHFEALLQYEVARDRSDSVPSINETPAGDPRFVWNLLGLTQETGGDPRFNAAVTDRHDALLKMDEGHRVDVDGVYLNMQLELGDLTFNSVTGYRYQKSRLPSTYTGEVGPVSLFDANRADNRETFQQELRVSSSFDGAFNFVAGAFYQKNDDRFCVVQVLGFLDLIGLINAVPGGFDQNPQVLCNRQDADTFALFTDATVDITDRLQLTGGFRYTWEKKSWAGRHQIFYQQLEGGFDPSLTWEDFDDALDAGDFEAYPFGVVRNARKWNKPTWRGTLSYDFSDDWYGYFTVSRGFKSGGYNDQTGTTGIPLDEATTQPYDPEYATSYELGVKADLMDRRWSFALTGFYVDYSDAQRGLVATLTNSFGQQFQETRFFNAAKIQVKGFEFETTVRPIDGLTIRGNAGFQDGKYKRFEADTDFDGDIDVDFSDRPLNRSPKWMATIDATYVHPVGNAGTLTWNVSYNYEARNAFIYSDVDPDFDTYLDPRNLVNASLTFDDMKSRYYVRVFGRNLTDDRYRISSQPVAALWTFTQYGQPRHYGIEVGFKL
ncbi:TonB-dependent receptor [Emcibacter sp. SYSU 3D8]|uniref:TonB-dependent receptor n=1 Tax=Emcibacter sp. SYSU 3D8 TaxID=3133969 RepID=UPI0031FEC20C